MKIYIYLGIAIILIAALCIFTVMYIDRTVSAVEDNLDKLTVAVDGTDWGRAKDIYQSSERDWDKKK